MMLFQNAIFSSSLPK